MYWAALPVQYFSPDTVLLQYCNGILRANVPYKVKLRAYLDTKVAMESEWIAVDGSEDDDEEEEKGGKSMLVDNRLI